MVLCNSHAYWRALLLEHLVWAACVSNNIGTVARVLAPLGRWKTLHGALRMTWRVWVAGSAPNRRQGNNEDRALTVGCVRHSAARRRDLTVVAIRA